MTWKSPIGGYKSPIRYVAPKRQPKPKPSGQLLKPRDACTAQYNVDEWRCHCGLTWPISEARPKCPKEET